VAQHKSASKTSGQRRTSMKSTKKTTASRGTKRGPSERAEVASPIEEQVSIDRRRSTRRDEEHAAIETPAAAGPQLERRKKVNRRRQIDPTTCERDYTDQEVEFMNALDDYKRKSGRMFPTCSEVLEVLHGLGYVKLSATEISERPADSSSEASAKPMPSDWPVSTTPLDESDEIAALQCEPQLAY
jgi:hypothetical protein